MSKESRKFDGKISTAYGKTISPALAFSGTFEAYTKDVAGINAAKADGKWPNDLDILEGLVNDSEKARKRAEAIEARLEREGISKPAADAPETLYNNTYKSLLLVKKPDGSLKYTDAEAKAAAAEMTGFTPSE